MTIEERLDQLEHRYRSLRVAFVLMACVLAYSAAAPLWAQVDPGSGWSQSVRGRTTFGSAQHATGATVDIVGQSGASAGLSILSRNEEAETFLLQGYLRPDGTWIKTFSLSTMWAQKPTSPPGQLGPTLITRWNTPRVIHGSGGALTYDTDINLMTCGGQGTVFDPANATNAAECPGDDVVAFDGKVIARKDVYISGKLIVNGRTIE